MRQQFSRYNSRKARERRFLTHLQLSVSAPALLTPGDDLIYTISWVGAAISQDVTIALAAGGTAVGVFSTSLSADVTASVAAFNLVAGFTALVYVSQGGLLTLKSGIVGPVTITRPTEVTAGAGTVSLTISDQTLGEIADDTATATVDV